MIKEHQSYIYASKVIKKQIPAPKYVIKQCKIFKNIADGKDKKYCIDEEKIEQIDDILKLLIMPKRIKSRTNNIRM